ncbi:hypothetical protein ACXR0O_11645 [Verrucomicrobiota bacterium sgz303538]
MCATPEFPWIGSVRLRFFLLLIIAGIGLVPHLRAAPSFASAATQGTVDVGPLRQASGIAVSRDNAGVLWTHNDAGDGPRIFALDTSGRLLGTYALTGADAVDYEDIAIGPGPVPGISYLFIGDIGDNNASRSNISVYQIPEPAVYVRQASNPRVSNLKGVRTLTLDYPDGAHNAEALCVDPLSGALFIATKEPGISRIYTATKAQLDAGGTILLTHVRDLSFDLANGASISPTGHEIIIRQEDFAQLWTRAPGQTIEAALEGTPVTIPVVGRPTEPNGEAIGFDSIGLGYYTLSDSATTQPLNYFARTSPFPFKVPRTLIAAGTTWKYLDNGSDQGTTWRQPGFNDTAWKTGDGPLGYGDADEQTTVGFGGKNNSKFITTYFRKTFTVTGKSGIGNVILKLQFDDGAAVYLNGTLVTRVNLNAGATFNSLATGLQEDTEDTWFTYSIDPALLIDGTNTLAVEVHQQSASSPDLSFDIQLLASDTLPLRFTALQRASDGAVNLEAEGPIGMAATVEVSDDLVRWNALGTLSLPGGTGIFRDLTTAGVSKRFYRAHR